jgi:DNA-binding CsgD family transcriptional regulator
MDEELPGPKRISPLLGRTTECALLDGLVGALRTGESRSLVLRGEPGIGKTALLEYMVDRASDLTVVRTAGVESAMELAYASLHELCAPMLPRRDKLPTPQRDALEVVFGLRSGAAPDRFLVALGVLSLFSEVADESPLLCVVDDAQWLDEASALTLAFVARRLRAEPVGIVFATRETRGALQPLPGLEVRGVETGAAGVLLGSAVPYRLDEEIRDRIVAETQGNPLALLELPHGLTATQLAGGFGLLDAHELSAQIEMSFLRRYETLPDEARLLVLVAAAEPTGDPVLLWRAAERLGIPGWLDDGVDTGGLLTIKDRVAFRHPLARSAVYGSAAVKERRAAHLALAQATDRDLDPDRRAWHLASAAAGPDEQVALELERSAGRAQTRGGLAATAGFLQRAVALTQDRARRADRALAAAQASLQVGGFDAALRLLATAEAHELNEFQRAQVDLLRAQIAFVSNRGKDAPGLLLRAAKRLESLDATFARETYLDALMAAQFAGRFAPGAVHDVAEAARGAPPAPSPRAPDVLLDGLAVTITEGHGAGVPLLTQALDAFRDGDVKANGGFRWLFLAEMAAIELWDYDTWRELTEREIQLVRDAGALTVLATALSVSIFVRIFAGELATAASLIDEQRIVTEASGTQLAPHASLILTAWRGREADLSALIDKTVEEVVARGEGIGLSATQWVKALLNNGLGRYDTALVAALELMEPPRQFDQAIGWALPELIEAAARTGRTELAADGLAQLSQLTRDSGTDWGLGLEARCRAMLSEGEAAEALHREAIERLGRARLRGEHARACLLYGEWLRRNGRDLEARDHLRTAHAMFSEMGMEAFAERARSELSAAGAAEVRRTVESRDYLTKQERQIARLARDGLSNPEIGSRLFLSPRTIEWHLRKVFGKLGIRSRRELADILPSDSEAVLS